MQWSFPLGNEIVCVSILNGTTYKGIDLLVEASMILKKNSFVKIKFTVCGVSSNEIV